MSSTSYPRRPRSAAAAVMAGALLVSAAGVAAGGGSPEATPVGDPAASPIEGEITVYTSVTQDTVDAVLASLSEVHPDLRVEVFRAPTGELDARIATEQRIGGIGADVLWMTDPLSVQRYEQDGLLAPLEGEAFDVVPPEFRGPTFVGTRLLNLVLVVGEDLEPAPVAWADLADPAYADRVAIPDPGFAGSAFAALGYFGTSDEYGMDFYRALEANGARQVQSPVDIVNGVAEGVYGVGITLDKIARSTLEAGAPIELIWPEPGAIALFSPAAVTTTSDAADAARAFVEFLVSPEGQTAIASTGWQPVRGDVEWPHEGAVLTPDWAELYGSQQQLLEEYDAIFGD